MHKRGIRKIRSAAPSRGKKRFRKRKPLGHKAIEVSFRETRSEKVNRMQSVLAEGGWKFKFKIEVLSPRGFQYQADGITGEEAFLKAFGQWRRDLVVPIQVPAKPLPKPVVKEALPKEQKPHLSEVVRELLDRYGSNLDQPGYRQLPKDLGAPADSRSYKRLYMRAYRAKKRLAIAA